MSERYQVSHTPIGVPIIVDTATSKTVFTAVDTMQADDAATLLNTQARELRQAQADAAALRQALEPFASVGDCLQRGILDSDPQWKNHEQLYNAANAIETTAGADFLRNYEHAQQVFKALEQIVAPYDIADELSIDEKVAMVIDTLKAENAKLRTALERICNTRDIDGDTGFWMAELAQVALKGE